MFKKIINITQGIISFAAIFMIICGISAFILLPELHSENIFGVGFIIMLVGMFLWLIILALIAMGEFRDASCIGEKKYLKLGLIVSILLFILQIYFRISYSHFLFLSTPNFITSYSNLEQNELWLIIANFILSFLLGYSVFSMLFENALYDCFTVLGYIIVGFISALVPMILINSPLLILVIFFYLIYKGEKINVRKCIVSGVVSIVLIAPSFIFHFDDCNLPIYANFQYEYNNELNTFDIVGIKNQGKYDRVKIPNKYLGKNVRVKDSSIFNYNIILEFAECPTWGYKYLHNSKKIEFTSGDAVEYFNVEKNACLIEVILPNNLRRIEDRAFYKCVNLTKIQIPKNVTYIGEEAFLGCTSLTNITIPESLTTIGNAVFEGCKSLEYNNYENASYLGNKDNPYLVLVKSLSHDVNKVVVNKNTRFICDYAFHYTYYEYLNNTVLLEEVVFEEGSRLKHIGRYAFSGCDYLKEIILPASLEEISFGAFSNCNSLVSLEIPEGVEYLPANLVSGKSFRFVLVPASVKKISIKAFRENFAYVEVYYYGSSSHWEEIEIEKESDSKEKFKVYVYYHYDFFEGPNEYWVKDENGVTRREYNHPQSN